MEMTKVVNLSNTFGNIAYVNVAAHPICVERLQVCEHHLFGWFRAVTAFAAGIFYEGLLSEFFSDRRNAEDMTCEVKLGLQPLTSHLQHYIF